MAEAAFYNSGRGVAYEDNIGIVTALGGAPLEDGEIASRIGGFVKIREIEDEKEPEIPNASELSEEEKAAELEKIKDAKTARKIAAVFATSNARHNSYQDGTEWLKEGKKGRQIDPILAGFYQINPALFRVEQVPMTVVGQGEVAVVKAYVGLEEKDISGKKFKFGAIVPVGHKGIWESTLRTGKYPINPRCYEIVIVPTSIITLNWATNVSAAHRLDARLDTITAKSNEGFEIKLELVVQIHIPENEAPRIISSVGTLQNLVDEVLQAAVGNYFRDTFQRKKAVEILNQRDIIQKEAFDYLKEKLAEYNKVELVAVLVQDVIYPEEMTKVLKERQIAVQQKETYEAERQAQIAKQDLEKERGNALTQAELAASKIRIEIAENKASSRKKEGEGEASYTTQTGEAKANAEKALQLAQAAGLIAKTKGLGSGLTALVEVGKEFAKSQTGVPFMPRTLVTGGGSGSASEQGLITAAMQAFQGFANYLPKESEEDEPIESTTETVSAAETEAKEETVTAETGDVSKEEPKEETKEESSDASFFEDMSRTK